MEININQTIIGTSLAFASVFLTNITLFFTIPENRNRIKVFIGTNFILWILINITTYLSIIPQEVALKTIIVVNLVIIIIMFFLVIIFSNLKSPTYLHKKSLSKAVEFGVDHLETIFTEYLKKPQITIADKRETMSAILQMISLTVVPATIENLVRITFFEVRNNGRFRILAAHNLDAYRIPKLERAFSHGNPYKGIVGRTVSEKRAIFIPDLGDKQNQDAKDWVRTPDNDIRGQETAGILCIPVFDDKNITSNSKCLGAISISSSKKHYFTREHQEQMTPYVKQATNILLALNSRIVFDSDTTHGIRAITLSGEVAAGKGYLAEHLMNYLKPSGWHVINTGQRFRDFCKSEGIPVENIAQIKDEVHEAFDDLQKLIITQEELVIVDGRLSGYFAKELGLKDVLTVYCDAPDAIRIERCAKRDGISLQDAKIHVKTRDEQDLLKFRRMYNINDYRIPSIYDLVLDTSKNDIEITREVFQKMGEMQDRI